MDGCYGAGVRVESAVFLVEWICTIGKGRGGGHFCSIIVGCGGWMQYAEEGGDGGPRLRGTWISSSDQLV